MDPKTILKLTRQIAGLTEEAGQMAAKLGSDEEYIPSLDVGPSPTVHEVAKRVASELRWGDKKVAKFFDPYHDLDGVPLEQLADAVVHELLDGIEQHIYSQHMRGDHDRAGFYTDFLLWLQRTVRFRTSSFEKNGKDGVSFEVTPPYKEWESNLLDRFREDRAAKEAALASDPYGDLVNWTLKVSGS